MPLAADIIRISIDGQSIVLRPSLRAASLLEAKHGFKAIFEGIAAGSLTMIADVIEIAGDYPAAVTALIHDIDRRGIVRLDHLKAPLVAFLTQMLASDDQVQKDETATAGPAQSLATYFDHLFRIGTGWLSWTPEQTWSATPAEIRAAYDGRNEMLKAIFGGKDDKVEQAPSKETLGEKIKGIFAGLGTTKIKREVA